jgi:hypothetical protein
VGDLFVYYFKGSSQQPSVPSSSRLLPSSLFSPSSLSSSSNLQSVYRVYIVYGVVFIDHDFSHFNISPLSSQSRHRLVSFLFSIFSNFNQFKKNLSSTSPVVKRKLRNRTRAKQQSNKSNKHNQTFVDKNIHIVNQASSISQSTPTITPLEPIR